MLASDIDLQVIGSTIGFFRTKPAVEGGWDQPRSTTRARVEQLSCGHGLRALAAYSSDVFKEERLMSKETVHFKEGFCCAHAAREPHVCCSFKEEERTILASASTEGHVSQGLFCCVSQQSIPSLETEHGARTFTS